MKIDYIDIILRVLIVSGVILIVYWFFQLMFGESPTVEQFIVGFIFVLAGLIVHLYYRSGEFSQFVKGTFPRFEKNVEGSFNRMKEDMSLLKGDMDLIKKKLKI